MTGVFTERGQFGHIDKHKGKLMREHHVHMKTEIRIMLLQTKELLSLLGAGRDQAKYLPYRCQREHGPPSDFSPLEM